MAVYTTIDNPELYFQIVLWTGDGTSGRSITLDGNSDMQPDWVWYKSRSNAYNHGVFDSVRGVDKFLKSNSSDAEATLSGVSAFNSNGFSVGSDAGSNGSGATFVAWNWLAGGTGSSNTDGSITSTVSASTTAGFSIVSYTGTGANATVGHGLGAVPQVFIIKNRSASGEWPVYHHSLTNAEQVSLFWADSGGTSGTSALRYNNTAPTSSVFSLGSSSLYNGSGNNMIAYCFAEKKGYSKFGSYTGNGSTDGTFVYTGFKPAWIMGKRTDSSNNWYMFDSTRNTSNVTDKKLRADETTDENVNSAKTIDILSNGFKVRSSDEEFNASGGSYIYMAFAEKPFVTSGVKLPTTAR